MQIGVIKNLISRYDLSTLKELEAQLTEGEELSHEVDGVDEGEQLTHIMGAIWSIEKAQENGGDPQKEVRNFIARVRKSIS